MPEMLPDIEEPTRVRRSNAVDAGSPTTLIMLLMTPYSGNANTRLFGIGGFTRSPVVLFTAVPRLTGESPGARSRIALQTWNVRSRHRPPYLIGSAFFITTDLFLEMAATP